MQGLGLDQFFIQNGLLTLPPPISAVCITLKILSFEQNHIAYIPEEYFHDCDSLVSVNFACNQLQYFPNISCLAYTIEQLNFANNMIHKIGALMETTFPMLLSLYLQHNRVTQFIFKHAKMPKLSFLNIAHNHLFYTPHLNNLITAPAPTTLASAYLAVKLSYNPWDCNAEYRWVLKLLCADGLMQIGNCFGGGSVSFWSHKNYTSRFCDVTQMLCATPPDMNGSSIRNAGKIHDDVIKWKRFSRYWPFVPSVNSLSEKKIHR